MVFTDSDWPSSPDFNFYSVSLMFPILFLGLLPNSNFFDWIEDFLVDLTFLVFLFYLGVAEAISESTFPGDIYSYWVYRSESLWIPVSNYLFAELSPSSSPSIDPFSTSLGTTTVIF